MARIAILDYGMGNLRSVEKALARLGSDATITADPEAARQADGVILPGVGAFPAAMRRVRELGLDELIRERVAGGVPVLGICLGLQLLFDSSTEQGGDEGIGLLAGETIELRAPGLKLPHIGWEPVVWERPSELTDGIASGTPFYFVHSFAVRPLEDAQTLGSARHGEQFACAVARPPVYGVQFHPEKSSAAGMKLLENFRSICGGLPSPGGSGRAAEHAAGK